MRQWQFQVQSTLFVYDTVVKSCSQVNEETYGVVLEDTIFSPEGDMGTMGDMMVKEVHYEEGDIVHFVPQHIEPGSVVELRIDKAQRRHIIHHTTARLLLGYELQEISKAAVVHSELNEDGGMVEMKRDFINPSEVRKVLHRCHGHISEDRAIKVFAVHYGQAVDIYRKHRVYLEPTRDQVLIVEIAGLGVFPYVGMVAPSTASMGTLVLEGVTKRDGRIRLMYATGDLGRKRVVEQAVVLDKVRKHLGVAEFQIMDTLKKRQEDFSTIATEYTKSFQEFLRQELSKVDEDARVVMNFYQELSPENLRLFSDKAIERYPAKIFILFTDVGGTLHYVCRGPQGSRYDMQQLSQFIARCIQGRGEGTANIAEGTGATKIPEEELVHMCSTFLQHYHINRPRNVSKKLIFQPVVDVDLVQ